MTDPNIPHEDKNKKNIELLTKTISTKPSNNITTNKPNTAGPSRVVTYNNNQKNSVNSNNKTKFSNEILSKYKSNNSLKPKPRRSTSKKDEDKVQANIPAKTNYRQNSELKEIEILNKQVKILSIGNFLLFNQY